MSQQQTNSQVLPFRRGDILDRKGGKLAYSEKVYNLVLDAKLMHSEEGVHLEPTLRALEQNFPRLDMNKIRTYVNENPNSRYKVFGEGKKLTLDEITPFKELMEKGVPVTVSGQEEREELAGVWFEEDYKRRYPYGSLGADVLGFVQGGNVGFFGLEEYYNSTLNGINGRKYGYMNEEAVMEDSIRHPEDGKTIITTLDTNIQSIVEKHILKFAETHANEYREGPAFDNIGVIVMNPKNGEIYAMAGYPVFDLNNPTDMSHIDLKWYLPKSVSADELEAERNGTLAEYWRAHGIDAVNSSLESPPPDDNGEPETPAGLGASGEAGPGNGQGGPGPENGQGGPDAGNGTVPGAGPAADGSYTGYGASPDSQGAETGYGSDGSGAGAGASGTGNGNTPGMSGASGTDNGNSPGTSGASGAGNGATPGTSGAGASDTGDGSTPGTSGAGASDTGYGNNSGTSGAGTSDTGYGSTPGTSGAGASDTGYGSTPGTSGAGASDTGYGNNSGTSGAGASGAGNTTTPGTSGASGTGNGNTPGTSGSGASDAGNSGPMGSSGAGAAETGNGAAFGASGAGAAEAGDAGLQIENSANIRNAPLENQNQEEVIQAPEGGNTNGSGPEGSNTNGSAPDGGNMNGPAPEGGQGPAGEGNPSNKEKKERMLPSVQARNNIWRNFCISDSFEPGSVMKPFTVAAALDCGKITGNESYQCNGYLEVGGFQIHCHNRLGDGLLTVQQGVAKSCNVVLMDIAFAMGKEEWRRYNKIFNFGLKTNIDLAGEANASELTFGENMGQTDLAVASFGQGFNVTMIQMAAGFSALINGGYYYQPRVVSEIQNSEGAVVEEKNPRLYKQVISEQASAKMREYLRSVVMSDRHDCTGWSARPAGYTEGGKTGTAEKYPRSAKNYLISFMGYVPADDPQVLCYVVIDRPNNSYQSESTRLATVLNKDIMTEVLPYLNIFPTEPLTEDEIKELEEKEISFATGSDGVSGNELLPEAQMGAETGGGEAESGGAGDSDDSEQLYDSAGNPISANIIRYDPETGYPLDPATGQVLNPITLLPLDGVNDSLPQ